MTEAAVREEVDRTLDAYESAIGARAGRTRNMIERQGVILALSRLMITADLQQGFKVLRDSHQLNKTLEAIVMRFRHLFSPDVVQAAEWRLTQADKLP